MYQKVGEEEWREFITSVGIDTGFLKVLRLKEEDPCLGSDRNCGLTRQLMAHLLGGGVFKVVMFLEEVP